MNILEIQEYFHKCSLLCIVLGYLFSCGVGHFIVRPLVRDFWRRVNNAPGYEPNDEDPPKIIQIFYGIIERGLFTTCVIFKPEGIAVWLAFKALMRIPLGVKNEKRHIPGSNIYLIGTALNLLIGVFGGFIVIWELRL